MLAAVLSVVASTLALLVTSGFTSALAQPLPETGSGFRARDAVSARSAMVVSAHPLATAAGLQVLRDGGNAIDAAVAVQMVLAVAEPQSSGIGGGAFLLFWDGKAVQAWDGRETAPASADGRLFLGADGRPPPWPEPVFGARAVGVPGALRMLDAVHRQHGRLPWARLLAPAIAAADEGVPVGPRLHRQLQDDPLLRRDPAARGFYYRDDGTPHPVGDRLRNPALAAVLRALAAGGSAALHEGPIATALVAQLHAHPVASGITAADLAGYRPLRRETICTDWRRWRVCGVPPPSSGHLMLMQTLGLLDRAEAVQPAAAPPLAAVAAVAAAAAAAAAADVATADVAIAKAIADATALHRATEALRLALADRAQFVADPAFAAAPGGDWRSLLDPAYLDARAALIGPRRMAQAPAGRPGAVRGAQAPMPEQPATGTSHASVVDGEGRAVALTTSIESAFGARMLSDGGTGLPGGFLLNNQLTDFALGPAAADGTPVANRVQGGARPRSTMAPTLVFERASGRLVAVAGSSGGPLIPQFLARVLRGIDALSATGDGASGGPDAAAIQAVLEQPNFGTVGDAVLLETGRHAPATIAALRGLGHTVQQVDLTSGLHLVVRSASGWTGAVDPRREGQALGDDGRDGDEAAATVLPMTAAASSGTGKAASSASQPSPAPPVAPVAPAAPVLQRRWLDLGERSLPVHWAWPAPSQGAPQALLLLQHGFARQCDRLRATTQALVAEGVMALCIDADMAGGNPALAREVAQTLLDGRLAPDGAALPYRIIVGGHSAGALFALHVGAALHAATPDRLAGALLLDPVATAGPAYAAALAAVSDGGRRRITAVLAPPAPCNARGNAVPALAALASAQRSSAARTDASNGVEIHLLADGSHLDAEGEDTTALAVRACGGTAPQPLAVQRLRALAAQAMQQMTLTAPRPMAPP